MTGSIGKIDHFSHFGLPTDTRRTVVSDHRTGSISNGKTADLSAGYIVCSAHYKGGRSVSGQRFRAWPAYAQRQVVAAKAAATQIKNTTSPNISILRSRSMSAARGIFFGSAPKFVGRSL